MRTRWQARLRGALGRSRLIANLHAIALLPLIYVMGSTSRGLEALLVACRRATWRPIRSLLRHRTRPLLEGNAAAVWRAQGIGVQRYLGSFADISEMTLSASIILKLPGPQGEKGVLYSSFEYNWMRITRAARAAEFFRDYYLVGASSWSPPDYASFAHLAGLSPDPAFIGISNLADMETYRLMAPVIEPLPLMACDWVNPDLFNPRPRNEREIDILMVANWLPFKRHWLLFEALRQLPRNINVVLVGRDGEGRTERTIREEAHAFGVRQDLQLHTDIDIQQVMDMHCNARVGVLLSAREGSCVAPVESFFGDTPVGMMKDGHVGSRAYINPQTGVLFSRETIGRQLAGFLERSDDFTPRKWALENVTCHRTSQRLNEHLKAHALGRNHPWTTDIAPLCWRYMPQHIRREDAERVRAVSATFAERYGFALEVPK